MLSIQPAALRAEFDQLRNEGRLSRAVAARLAEQASRACVAAQDELHEAVELLCELATLEDPDLARVGADAIFRHAIESMGDAFDVILCDRYIHFFAHLLDHCRRLPGARWLDERLRRFGLRSYDDLVDRALRLRTPRPAKLREIEKVVVLSRVTLGADVAITSLILRKFLSALPRAEIVLLASPKAALLFAGEKRVAVHPIEYPRRGGLLDRLRSWPQAVDAVQAEIEGLRSGQYAVVDPDSRFTQLGMLPIVTGDEGCHFFESRSFTRPGLETLAALTAAWLREVFGPDDSPLEPWVSLPAEAVRFADGLRCAAPEARRVAVNLGVGDNPAKRIDDPFEELLLTRLLDSGSRIFLDKGEGEEEVARVERLLARLRAIGWQTAEVVENGPMPDTAAQVVAWRGSLAGFAALIGASDLYIGYDSACQHIAAALGVKTVDIFSGFRSPRMVERWKPSGPGEVRLVVVDPQTRADPGKILQAVLEAAR